MNQNSPNFFLLPLIGQVAKPVRMFFFSLFFVLHGLLRTTAHVDGETNGAVPAVIEHR